MFFTALQDIFSTLGTVTEVCIVRDPATCLSQGSAYITFDSHEAAALAQQTLNGHMLCNKVSLAGCCACARVLSASL